MLARAIFVLAAAAATPAALLARGEAPETLTRSSNWIVDYSEDACHLAADFGTGEERVIMRMSRYDLGDWFSLNLYGSRFRSKDVRKKVKVDFGLGAQPVETHAMSGRVGDMDAIFLSAVRLDGWKSTSPGQVAPKTTPEQEASVNGVSVEVAEKKPFRLQFGSLGKPMAQLRSCQADLVRSWGYDPAVQAALSRPAKRIDAETALVHGRDYPDEAARRGANGIVRVRLDLDETGNVEGCHVVDRTKPDMFADITCRAVTKRAKFEPALDTQGKPARTFTIIQFVWFVT